VGEVYKTVEASSGKKVNVIELDFKIGHMEAGYVLYENPTDVIKVEFRKPFAVAPTVIFGVVIIDWMRVCPREAVAALQRAVRGYVPYVAVGLDVNFSAGYDVADEIEKLRGEINVKSTAAGIGGALGGLVLEEIVRRVGP